MTEDDYLKLRLDDQIDWYSLNARKNKKLHYYSKAAIIIISSLIPLLAGIHFSGYYKDVIIGLLGASIAILTGITSLLKFQEKWSEYRMTAETLIQEKILFQTSTGPFSDEQDSFKLLVNRFESLLTREHNAWSQYINENNNTHT